jgi:hypothetical protein
LNKGGLKLKKFMRPMRATNVPLEVFLNHPKKTSITESYFPYAQPSSSSKQKKTPLGED